MPATCRSRAMTAALPWAASRSAMTCRCTASFWAHMAPWRSARCRRTRSLTTLTIQGGEGVTLERHGFSTDLTLLAQVGARAGVVVGQESAGLCQGRRRVQQAAHRRDRRQCRGQPRHVPDRLYRGRRRRFPPQQEPDPGHFLGASRSGRPEFRAGRLWLGIGRIFRRHRKTGTQVQILAVRRALRLSAGLRPRLA